MACGVQSHTAEGGLMVGLEMGESECCLDPSHSPLQELDMTINARA